MIKKQGILLEEIDIESICDAYDVEKTDYFNFINFLNALRNVSNTRGSQIKSFKEQEEQVKAPGQNYISLSNLLRIADMNYHPEAIKFIRSVPDLRREYEYILIKIAKEDVLSEDDFRQFFYDVSTCVANDADFTQILRSLGYK